MPEGVLCATLVVSVAYILSCVRVCEKENVQNFISV